MVIMSTLEKLGNGCTGPLCTIFTTSFESLIISQQEITESMMQGGEKRWEEGESEKDRNSEGFQTRSRIKRTELPFYLNQQQQNFLNRQNT